MSIRRYADFEKLYGKYLESGSTRADEYEPTIEKGSYITRSDSGREYVDIFGVKIIGVDHEILKDCLDYLGLDWTDSGFFVEKTLVALPFLVIPLNKISYNGTQYVSCTICTAEEISIPYDLKIPFNVDIVINYDHLSDLKAFTSYLTNYWVTLSHPILTDAQYKLLQELLIVLIQMLLRVTKMEVLKVPCDDGDDDDGDDDDII